MSDNERAPETNLQPVVDHDDCGSRSSADFTAIPSQTLAIPASALAGFPNGRTPRELSRRRLLAEGIVGVASVYAATRLDWSQVFESAVAEADAMQKSLVVIYLQGGNDGLNVTVPVDTVYTGYQAARANIARVVGPSAGGKVGTWTMGGTGGSLGFANVCVSTAGTRRQRRSGARLRQPLRRRQRRRRLRPRGVPRRRLHAVEPLALRERRHLVRRLDREADDRLARPLARPLRLADEPAAGGLDRRLAEQADPHVDGARVRAADRSRARASTCRASTARRSTRRRSCRRSRACPPAPATITSRARAAPTAPRSTWRTASPRSRARQRAPATRPAPTSRRSCRRRRSCSAPGSAPASSRSTGAASTPTATSSTRRIRSSRTSRARSRRSRPTSSPAASRTRC